jgi:site-specific DNA-methyltransferase (adenine-specific)
MFQIYQVDCISGAKKYIDDNSVDLIITDPPYGINGELLHRHYNRNENYVLDGYKEVERDQYELFSRNWILEAERVLRPGGSLYIISGYSNLIHLLNALRKTTLEEKNHIIWKYNFGVYTKNKYVSAHYHILYFTKPGGKTTFNLYSRFGPGERNSKARSLNYQDREDVWYINREYKPNKIKNKNELPTELLIKIIEYSSNVDNLVADFFLGGFSTARVAIGLKRRIIGFEINHNAFIHNLQELKKLKPGYLLPLIKEISVELPKNQGKKWNTNDLGKLHQRYIEIYSEIKNKKQTINKLQKEFGRGYFAILNQITNF